MTTPMTTADNKPPKINECEFCNKEFKDRSNCFRHKKTCKSNPNKPPDDNIIETLKNKLEEQKILNEEKVNDLKKQLEEQKRLYEERIQDLKHELQQQHLLVTTLVTSNHQPQQNQIITQPPQQPQQSQLPQQPFIIQLPGKPERPEKPKFILKRFLNETCKDAINITDFKDSIVITNNDVELVEDEKLQIVLSNLIMKKLQNPITRPFYVSNVQEKTIWVKNEDNEWIEDTDKKLIKNLITITASKYLQLTLKLKQQNRPTKDIENVIPKYDKLHHKVLTELCDISDNPNLVYNYLFPLLKINKEKYVYDDNENLTMRGQ